MENKRIGFASAINSKSRIGDEEEQIITTTETIVTTQRRGNFTDLEGILSNLFTYLYLLIEYLISLVF